MCTNIPSRPIPIKSTTRLLFIFADLVLHESKLWRNESIDVGRRPNPREPPQQLQRTFVGLRGATHLRDTHNRDGGGGGDDHDGGGDPNKESPEKPRAHATTHTLIALPCTYTHTHTHTCTAQSLAQNETNVPMRETERSAPV